VISLKFSIVPDWTSGIREISVDGFAAAVAVSG